MAEIMKFRSKRGSFQFNVMPFWLKNVPAALQRFAEAVLGDFPFVLTHVDDILIRSADLSEHVGHVANVFYRLRDAGVKVNLKKCKFGKATVSLLGNMVSGAGICPDKKKVEAIRKAPGLTSRNVLQSFFGMEYFYRKFIKGFAKIANPLTELTSPRVRFVWGDAQQEKNFSTTMDTLTTALALVQPDFDGDFVVHTGASKVAIGAVLSQLNAARMKQPVVFSSRFLQAAENNYIAFERKALAMV